MKSKTEIKLDKEFEKFRTKLRIYHFKSIAPFTAVTIVTETSDIWTDTEGYIFASLGPQKNEYNRATHLLQNLATLGFYGVAICDKRDQFNRQRGRVIAKGRLLKHLKEEISIKKVKEWRTTKNENRKLLFIPSFLSSSITEDKTNRR